ncbi:34285_t:CDS:2, partial [Racocetra persica]
YDAFRAVGYDLDMALTAGYEEAVKNVEIARARVKLTQSRHEGLTGRDKEIEMAKQAALMKKNKINTQGSMDIQENETVEVKLHATTAE